MGAEYPQPLQPPTTPKAKSAGPVIFATTLPLVIVCALKWREVTQYVNDEPQLSPKHQQLQRKLNELEAAEQYALVAMSDGWYPCLHSGRTLYYLHTGEVWKYGVTIKGERGRYTTEFLQDNGVLYIIQFKGPMTECLQEEQRKLFSYPLLPENLARLELDRLVRPPYNPVLK